MITRMIRLRQSEYLFQRTARIRWKCIPPFRRRSPPVRNLGIYAPANRWEKKPTNGPIRPHRIDTPVTMPKNTSPNSTPGP